MAGSSQEKSEKPTGKRIDQARSRGNVPKSRELNSVVVLLGGGVAVYLSSQTIYDHFQGMLHDFWGGGFRRAAAGDVFGTQFFLTVMAHMGAMLAPALITVLVLAVTVNVLQTGGLLIAFESIKPSLGKLNPLAGMKRLVSKRSLIELVKSLLKLIIVSGVVYSVLHSQYHLIPLMSTQELPEIAGTLDHLIMSIFVRVCVVMLLLSIADTYYQRWQYQRDLMMTKQEVKEENKQSEGDPKIKARIRSAMRALARKRMMASVPKASVVITNPTHFAVALLYESQMEAPRVIAKGMDHIALRIIEIARKSRVPVVQNPPLARALYQQVKLEATIPVGLYRAVAKVLAYIYQQKSRSAR